VVNLANVKLRIEFSGLRSDLSRSITLCVKLMDVEHLVEEVKKASQEVYKVLGAGYNESIYEEALGVEL